MRALARRALPVVGYLLVVLVASAVAPVGGAVVAVLLLNYAAVYRRVEREKTATARALHAADARRPVGPIHPIRRHYPADS